MTPEIKHRRLYAFYNSTALNALMIAMVVCLMLSVIITPAEIPLLAGAIVLLYCIGYSLWLWLKKPAAIEISPALSNISSIFLLYYLIIVAVSPDNAWWYIIPAFVALPAVLYFATGSRKEIFDI